MVTHGGQNRLAFLLVVSLLVPILGFASASAHTDDGGDVAIQDIAVRNELIAAQESLLNIYRCLFDIDIQVVPDGCVDGQPARGPTESSQFEGTPNQHDIAVRDRLIQAQESLLNVYRCRFNVDT